MTLSLITEMHYLVNQWKSSKFSLFHKVARPNMVRVGATGLVTAVAVGIAWKSGLLIGSAFYEGFTGNGCN